ncbi:MAG TPA: hypothetical protein VFZ70_08770 [Euzebyales bacterium]
MLTDGALTALRAAAAPADGQCVATGVKTLGGPTIAAAANGDLLRSNVVDFVIRDHAFNNADETEALLGITICE